MQNENKWEDETRTEKNGETRCKTKEMGRPDVRQKKKWGDKTGDEKNGETRRETKRK